MKLKAQQNTSKVTSDYFRSKTIVRYNCKIVVAIKLIYLKKYG